MKKIGGKSISSSALRLCLPNGVQQLSSGQSLAFSPFIWCGQHWNSKIKSPICQTQIRHSSTFSFPEISARVMGSCGRSSEKWNQDPKLGRRLLFVLCLLCIFLSLTVWALHTEPCMALAWFGPRFSWSLNIDKY